MAKNRYKIFRPKDLPMLFQVFSLDVTGGALASGYFWARLLGVSVRPVWLLVLALSVWVVYTADHLVDGMAKKHLATIRRHRFHYRYRYIIAGTLILAALSAVWLARFFLGENVFKNGLILGMLALVYLSLVFVVRKSRFYFHKEFFIALFYVAGTALAPVTWYHRPLSATVTVLLIVYVLLAWSESILMSFYEKDEDQKDQLESFTTYYGPSFTLKFMRILLVVLAVFLAMSALLCSLWRGYFFLLWIMDVFLLFLSLFPTFYKVDHRYRWWGEFIFWLPFLLIL